VHVAWDTSAGNAYFIQFSYNLKDWHFFPEIFAGDDFRKQIEVILDPSVFMVRILSFPHGLPPGSNVQAELEEGDYDQDGYSNLNELLAGTSPITFNSGPDNPNGPGPRDEGPDLPPPPGARFRLDIVELRDGAPARRIQIFLDASLKILSIDEAETDTLSSPPKPWGPAIALAVEGKELKLELDIAVIGPVFDSEQKITYLLREEGNPEFNGKPIKEVFKVFEFIIPANDDNSNTKDNIKGEQFIGSDPGQRSLLPVEFITPAGDPVAQPKDAGDGQNEFTFNGAKPGVLEINLKVKVAGLGAMPADIQNKFLFEVDAIGNSQMQWDAANAGGKPTFNGDFMTAKVKFTGLPQINSDFGKKMARIKFDGNGAGEEDIEVFYTGTAKNHQDQANPAHPNWFVYYKQNSGGGAYRYRNAAQSISRPGRGDASIELGNDAYIKNGNFFFETAQQGGRLRLVKEIGGLTSFYTSFVGVLAHEKHHANSETQDRNLDPDGDFISSNFEQNTSKTDPADSHSADGAGVHDDSEVYANGPVEKAAVDGADNSKDWANPGSNYGKQN